MYTLLVSDKLLDHTGVVNLTIFIIPKGSVLIGEDIVSYKLVVFKFNILMVLAT